MATSDSLFATAVPIVPIEPNFDSKSKSAVLPINTPPPAEIDEHQVGKLMEQGFTRGLARSLTGNNLAFQSRIWVVDNSGSMQKPDGHRIVDTLDHDSVKIVDGTRWEEIRECVRYHIRMANLLQAPTRFRLLNHPGATVGAQEFGVAETIHNNNGSPQEQEQTATTILRKTRPSGCTPLTAHMQEIYAIVSNMAPSLRRDGRKVVIVIATDGLPTDEGGIGGAYESRRFVEALRALEGLPVWVVIRLCTDEDEVVNFYNDLDEQLELSLEVLDDYCGEAAEVYQFNPWLNYTLPLHRCREMGYHHRVFDLIDERTLTKSELREFMELIFGEDQMDGVPDPSVDWMGFTLNVERLLRREKPQWNPMTKTVTPWIDVRKLNRTYGGTGNECCIIL